MKTIQEQVEESLASNPNWTNVMSIDPEIEKKWKLSKIIILRWMVKDLEILQFEERRDTGNNQAFTMVLSIVCREIHSANWQAKCGTIPIWKGIFSRAQGVAKKNTTGVTALNTLSKGLIKNVKESKYGACSQQRIQGSSSRP